MRWGFLWLTLRLIMKQRLRTITLFCGIFSLVFYLMLLEVWGITFGHKYMKEIPTQVHLILPN